MCFSELIFNLHREDWISSIEHLSKRLEKEKQQGAPANLHDDSHHRPKMVSMYSGHSMSLQHMLDTIPSQILMIFVI